MKKIISIVVPVFNESKNIGLVHQQLSAIFANQLNGYNFEIIFVDDGSIDNSFAKMKKLAGNDPRVKCLGFCRNFGHQAALSAGLKHATGEAVISMDCDLQDPPVLIVELIKKWEEGYQVVYARRKNRVDGFFKKYSAILYYRILDNFSSVRIPRNVGDFRLIDRKVVRIINKMPEKAKYLRGMVAWTGYKYTFVDFDRPERIHGQTGYTLKKMMRLGMDGILNFSMLPLQIGLWLGLASIFLGALMVVYMVGDIFINDVNYPLYKFLIVVLFILMGFLFMLIWILGEYVGRIYSEVQDRPLYIIENKINFKKK